MLEDAAKQADLYATNFEHVRAMNLEQEKLETDVLDVVGQQMTDGLSGIMAGGVKASNGDLQRLAAEGRRLSLVARLDVNKRMGRHDEAAAKSAEQQFADLKQILAQLDAVDEGQRPEWDSQERSDAPGSIPDRLQTCGEPGCRSACAGERRHAAGRRRADGR